jgi:hypothetical protein
MSISNKTAGVKSSTKTASPRKKLTIHTKFRGNAQSLRRQLSKLGLLKTLNGDIEPRLEKIAYDDLIPLETQRWTDASWVKKALTQRGGFDRVAGGALFVAHDPTDGNNYVFDGCGRWALGKIVGLDSHATCLVWDINRKQAAGYFSYNQSKGRRSLDMETIFINEWESGASDEAIAQGLLLRELNCHIIGKTNFPVPPNHAPDSAVVKYAFITKGYEKAEGDTALLRQVRDLICGAWQPFSLDKRGNPKPLVIRQDLWMGLITLMRIYPELRRDKNSTLFDLLAEFLQNVATLKPDQKDLDWKRRGLNLHNHDDLSVAVSIHYDFYRSFKNKPHRKYVENSIPFHKIRAEMTRVLGNGADTNDDSGDDMPVDITQLLKDPAITLFE